MGKHPYLRILISVTLAGAGLHCATEDCPGPGIPNDMLVPDVVALELSSAQQFELITYGDPHEVGWYVDGVQGGSPDIGMITQTGLYVAPPAPHDDVRLMVIARSMTRPEKSGIARITVRKPLQSFVGLEDYTESSGAGITRGITCGGGIGVTGLDGAGEWIKVPLFVEIGGRYLAYVRYAGADHDELGLTVTMTGCCGEVSSEHATFLLNKGSGVDG